MYSHFESYLEFALTQLDEIKSGTTRHVTSLSYTANAMPADALATLGASASTGMVLTCQAGIFCLQH